MKQSRIISLFKPISRVKTQRKIVSTMRCIKNSKRAIIPKETYNQSIKVF